MRRFGWLIKFNAGPISNSGFCGSGPGGGTTTNASALAISDGTSRMKGFDDLQDEVSESEGDGDRDSFVTEDEVENLRAEGR